MADRLDAELDNIFNTPLGDPIQPVDTTPEPLVEVNALDNDLDAILGNIAQSPSNRDNFKITEVTKDFDTKPLFQESVLQKPSDEQKAQAQSFLPAPVYQAVDTFLFEPFKRVFDNTTAGLKSFNHMFYSGLREISKVVEEATGAKHNASDFFARIAKDIEQSGITPVSDHWADQIVYMIGNALPSAGLGIGTGAAAQLATQTALGASAKMAPAMARFMGEAGIGAFEGVGRAAQSGEDIAMGAGQGAKEFGLFELASSFGSRYGKAFQIGFSTALGAGVGALSPDATKDDILATAIMGAVFALPGRTQSGDIKTDLNNIMTWVKKKRANGVEPTPSSYIEENLPASIEMANTDSIMEPYNRTDQSPYDAFKENVAKEVGIDSSKITDDQVFSKMADEMGSDGAAAALNALKKESDIWVQQQKSLDDIVEVPRGDRTIKVSKRIAQDIPKIEKSIENVKLREKQLEDSLVKKPAEVLAQKKKSLTDAFLNVYRRLEEEYEKFPEGRNILELLNIQHSATAISELNFNDALKDIGIIKKNFLDTTNMSKTELDDFSRVADAMTQIDKIKRQEGYKSPYGQGQKALDHYEFIIADTKSKYEFEGKGNQLQNRLDTYFGVFQKYLKDAHTAGVITDKAYNSMKDIIYSPTQYIEFLKKEIDFDADLQRKPLFDLKKLGTGKDDVNITNPEYLLSGHINRFDYIIAKNNQLNATHEFALKYPENAIARTVKQEGFSKEVSFKKKGEPTKLYISDEFAKAYDADSLFSDNYNHIIRGAQTALGSNVVKSFATGAFNPTFFLASIPRDFFFFNMNNYWKGQSNILPVDIAKGAKGIVVNGFDALLKTDKYKRFVRAGGSSGVMANEMKRVAFAERNARLVKPRSKIEKIWDKSIDVLSSGNHAAEVATRMHFADLIFDNGKNGLSYEQAVGEVSRMLDFRRRGPAAELVEIGVPYFNVTVQALERFHRGAKKQSKSLYAAKLAQWMGAAYMLASYPYWMAEQTGDEELKQSFLNALANDSMDQKLREVRIPIGHYDIDKDGNRTEYVFAIKKEQFPITVALDYLMHSMLEQQYLGIEPDEKIFQEIARAAIPFDFHQVIPPTVKAASAIWMNQDLQNFRPISNPNIPATERVQNASELSKAIGQSSLGQQLNISPEGLDVAARSLAPSSFLKGMLGITINGISPEAERDIARAFTEYPGTNQFIKKSTLSSRAARGLQDRRDDLMTAQQKRVNQPVLDMIEKMKNKEITYSDSINSIRKNTALTQLEKKAAVEKLKSFAEGEELYKRITNRDRFIKNPGSAGFLTSWRNYYSLYVQLSDPEAGVDAANYVVSTFLSTDDDPELKRVIKSLGQVYLPRKHRYAFTKEFNRLTEGK